MKIQTISGTTVSHKFSSDRIYEELQDALIAETPFIIVECKFYNVVTECTNMVLRKHYTVFGIDLFIDTDSQVYYNHSSGMNSSSLFHRKVQEYTDYMEKYPMRDEVTMLDPIELYVADYKIQLFFNNYKEKMSYEATKFCEDDSNIVRELSKTIVSDSRELANFPAGLATSVNLDEEVSDILAEILNRNHFQAQKSVTELYISALPDLRTSEVINYGHKHKTTFAEEVSEFNLTKVYDYRHRRNLHLLEAVGDVDIDEVIESKKEEAKKKRTEMYIQQGAESCALESNPNYPNNWEVVVEFERETPAGKRKKKKNAKIERILSETSTREVRKRVKRLKIEDEIHAEMEVDGNVKQSVHIQQLLALTTLINVADDVKDEYLEYINSFYRRLDQDDGMSSIIKLAVSADFLEINFNFTDSFTVDFCNATKISILTQNKTEIEIMASIAHDLTHSAMNLLYWNNTKPYRARDDDRKDEIERILFDIEYRDTENHEVIRRCLSSRDESQWSSEIMACVSEIIILGQKEILAQRYEHLWNFYSRSLTEVEQFLRKFDTCKRLSCFSHN